MAQHCERFAGLIPLIPLIPLQNLAPIKKWQHWLPQQTWNGPTVTAVTHHPSGCDHGGQFMLSLFTSIGFSLHRFGVDCSRK
jgi:hypothetical protein